MTQQNANSRSANPLNEFSVSPSGEKFAIPHEQDYAAEFQRLEKLVSEARQEGICGLADSEESLRCAQYRVHSRAYPQLRARHAGPRLCREHPRFLASLLRLGLPS